MFVLKCCFKKTVSFRQERYTPRLYGDNADDWILQENIEPRSRYRVYKTQKEVNGIHIVDFASQTQTSRKEN